MISLRSLFIQDDDEDKKRKEANVKIPVKEVPQAQPTPKKQPEVATPQAPVIKKTGNGEINENAVKQMWEILGERNLPGPDFLEVKNYADSMAKAGLDKAKCYEAAYYMLKAQYPDFNKQTILDSIDTYIAYVNEEYQNGKNQFARKRYRVVDSKMQEIANLEQENIDITKKIEELKMQLEKNTANIGVLKTEAEKADANMVREETIFNNSFSHVIETLKEDKELTKTLNIN